MAGEWIPYTKDLPRKPETLRIHRLTGLRIADVVLTLLEMWAWADSQTPDGYLPGIAFADLAALLSGWIPHDVRIDADICPRFLRAMSEVGWLKEDKDGMEFPNFGLLMGQSAKRRLADSRRKRQGRHDRTPKAARRPVDVRTDADKMRTTIQDNTIHDETPLVSPSEEVADARGGGSARPGASIPPRNPILDATTPPATYVPDPARNTTADHPRLAPLAESIVDEYVARVKPIHSVRGGQSAVVALLSTGVPEADLRRSIAGYLAWCERHDKHGEFRLGVAGFFGDGEWKRHRDGPAPPSRRPPSQRDPGAPPPGSKLLTPEELAAQKASVRGAGSPRKEAGNAG